MDSGGDCSQSCDSPALSSSSSLSTSPSTSFLSSGRIETTPLPCNIIQLSRPYNHDNCDGSNLLPEENYLGKMEQHISSSCVYGAHGGLSHNLTATFTSAMMVTHTTSGIEAKDVWKCGYLTKLKTSNKRFFVLRGPSNTGPSRLEYYDSEKKFRNRITSCKPTSAVSSPKRIIYLHQCLTISKRADSKHRHLIALYTKNEYFVMIAESEKEQEDWCLALNELMIEEKKEYQDADDLDDGYWTLSPGTIFKEVWQVIVKAKGLGQTKNMVGVCRLCLSSKTIRLVKASVDTPSVNLPLVSIRRCGHSESFFFIEMGRSSSTGPGEIWMQVDSGDPLQAQNIHETILEAMRALRAIPDFRQRSASQSYPSNPYAAVLTRRHPHGNLPPSQTGLWCTSKAGSVREQSSKKREECMSIASDSGRSIDKHPWHPDTSTCSSPSDRGSVNFEVLDSKSCIFQVSNVNTTATPCNTTPLEENSQGERFKAEKSTPERSRGHNRNTLYTPKCETFLSSKASTLRCQSELAVEDGYMPMTPGLVPNGSDGTPSEVGLPNTPPITPDATSLPVDPAKPHEYMSMFPRSSSKAKDRLREIDPSPSDEYVTMSLRSTVEDFSGGSSEDLKSCRSSCTPPTTRHDPLQKNSECDDYVPMCHFVGHALKGTRRRLFRSSPWPTSHLNTDVGLDTSNVCLFAVAGLSVEGGQLTKTKLISNSSDCLNNNAVNPGHCVTCDARWPTGDATSHLGSSRHQRSCPETYGVSELCDSTGQNTATRRWIHSCFPFCLNTDDDSE